LGLNGEKNLRRGFVALGKLELDQMKATRVVGERVARTGTQLAAVFRVGSLVKVLSDVVRKRGILDKKKARYYGPFKVACDLKVY
jgi:hypothetical protein